MRVINLRASKRPHSGKKNMRVRYMGDFYQRTFIELTEIDKQGAVVVVWPFLVFMQNLIFVLKI